MGSELFAILPFNSTQSNARRGFCCCIPLTSVAVQLQSSVKSHCGQCFAATGGSNHLVGDGIFCILWLFPLGRSRRGLWVVEVKSDWLFQTFWRVGCSPLPSILLLFTAPSSASAGVLLPGVATSFRWWVPSSPSLSPCRH